MATTHSPEGTQCLQEGVPAHRKGRCPTCVFWDYVQCLMSGFSSSVCILRCDLQEGKHNAGRSCRLMLKNPKPQNPSKTFLKLTEESLFFLGNLTVLIGEIAFAV